MINVNKILNFCKKPFFKKVESIKNLYFLLKTKFWYSYFFNKIGRETKIIKPLKLTNPEYITVHDNVTINQLTWLLALNVTKEPKLIIDDGSQIGHFNHITCIDEVKIGKNVLTADKVYISDNYHDYEDISIPILYQNVKSKGPVNIGDQTWIGENVSIISCSIGKHCIIGANSVITKDIPDYCVVVGAPGKIIKRYDLESGKWKKTNEKGEFI